MENNQNPAGNTNQPGGPRLKKVKRPIQKMSPQGANMGNSAPTANTGGNPFIQNKPTTSAQAASSEAFNLDAFLDGEEKIPAVKNVPGKYNQRQPNFIDDEQELETGKPRSEDYPTSDVPPYLTRNILILLGVVILVVGMVMSKLLFGSSQVVQNGLQGVVINAEVPRGRARCGLAEKTQGCVLYIMNPQRQELNARDFYDLASQMTGRQRFVIETGNMRYANTKIRPGDIAQLNIPPL